MAENTSTLTIELNTTDAQTAAANLAAKVALVGSNLAVTLAKFTEFQSKLNAINAKVNINVNKINDIVNVQQAVDAYLATKNIKGINIKANAKLAIDKVTGITGLPEATNAYISTIKAKNIELKANAKISIQATTVNDKSIKNAIKASTFVAERPIDIIVDAKLKVKDVTKIDESTLKAAIKASTVTSKTKIDVFADVKLFIRSITSIDPQSLRSALRASTFIAADRNVATLAVRARLFVRDITGVDAQSIRDAIRNRTTPIEITTPITVVAKRIRIIADPTANVTVIIGQLQAAGANTDAVTNKTNNWYKKLLDIYLIHRAITSVTEKFVHLWETGLSLAQIETTLTVITGSLKTAGTETEWLMKTSNAIGLNFQNAAGPFAKFAAAAKGMFSSSEIKQMYMDLGKVAVAMHLNKEETNGVFLAIQQMASKGTVSLEELRLQFAERIPGAMAIAAASMNMSMLEFTKRVSNGELGSEFLKKFLHDLSSNFATASDLAAKSFIGMQSRFENALFSMKATISTSGFMDAIGAVMEDVTKSISTNKTSITALGVAIGDAITSIYKDLKSFFGGKDFAAILVEGFKSTLESLKSFIGLLSTLGPVVTGFIKAVQALSLVMNDLGLVLEMVKFSFLGWKGLFGGDVTRELEASSNAMAEMAKRGNEIAESFFGINSNKLEVPTDTAVANLRLLQQEIKVTETDYKILSDKFAVNLKATSAVFNTPADQTISAAKSEAGGLAVVSEMDKVGTAVDSSQKKLKEFENNFQSLNFDVKGKSIADTLKNYLKVSDPELEKDSTRLQEEFTKLKDALKLKSEDFLPREAPGKLADVFKEEYTLAKIASDVVKNQLEAANNDVNAKIQAIDATIASYQAKKTQAGDSAPSDMFNAEIEAQRQLKESIQQTSSIAVAGLNKQLAESVSRANTFGALADELRGIAAKDLEGIKKYEASRLESQAKINDEMSKEYETRSKILESTKELFQKEEQRQRLEAIASGEVKDSRDFATVYAELHRAQDQVDLMLTMQNAQADTLVKNTNNQVQAQQAVTQELRQQVQLSDSLAKKVASVSNPANATNVNIVKQAASNVGINPNLALAVAAKETTNFNARSVSPTGAKGLMQMFPAALSDVGASGIDVFNPEQNAKAGTAYLKLLLDRYKKFPQQVEYAVAAYNAGMGNVDKAIKQASKTGESYSKFLSKEAQDYLTTVPKIFAQLEGLNGAKVDLTASSKANIDVTAAEVQAQQEANKVDKETLKGKQDLIQMSANARKELEAMIDADIDAVLKSSKVLKELQGAKLEKFNASEFLQAQGQAGIPEIQRRVEQAQLDWDKNLELLTAKAQEAKELKAKILSGKLSEGETTAEKSRLYDMAASNAILAENTRKSQSIYEELSKAVPDFQKDVAREFANLAQNTQAMNEELANGVDYANRIRAGLRGGSQALEIFDANKTTRDFLEFTKAAGTSVDGLKETFASVFIAMGDTTKTFTQSMADMFDNMVTRMLDASAKLMANGLLDWFNNVQGGGTNFLLGAIGTAVSLGVKFLSKTPSRSSPSTAQTGDSSALGIASMRAADVFGRDTAFQFDTVAAAQYNANLKTLAGVAYDNSKNIVEFLSNISDSIGTTGAASYVKDLFSPVTNAFTKGSALIDSATSSFSSSFTGLTDKYIAPAFDYVSNLLGVGSSTAGFAGLTGGSIAANWSSGIAQLPSAAWTGGTNGIYSLGQTGSFAGSVQASEAAAENAGSAFGGLSEALGTGAQVIGVLKAGWDIVNTAMDKTASIGEQVASSFYAVRNAAMAFGPGGLLVAGVANFIGSISDMFDGDFKRGLRNAIFGPFGDIIAELTGFLKTRTPNAWINQFNPLGSGYTPEKMAPITAQAPGYKALGEGLYQRGTNKGLFIGTETRLGSVELSYHEIHRKTDMTELDTQFKALLKIYRQTNNTIANSLDAIDAINKESVSTVGLFLGKLSDGEEKNRIALKQELSDLDTGNMTDKLYGDISVRLRETGTKAGMIWSTIFDNLMVAFKNISVDNSVFAAGAANLASLLAIPLNQFSVQVVDDLTKAIKAPAIGGNISDVEKELETNFSAFKKMFAVINDPQFGIGAGVSDTKISGLIMSWSKLGLGIEETSNSWIAFVDLFNKAQPTLDVTKFESEMTKAWDGLIKKFTDTGLTQVQAVSLTSSAVVGASVLKEKGVADKDLLQGGLAFAEAARKAATKNLEAAEAAIQDAIAKGKAEGVLKASMSREQMTAILIRTKAIDQQTAIEADFTVQQAKATQNLLEGYGAIFSVVNGLGLRLEDFGISVADIPTVIDNLTTSFGDMSKAIDFVRENIKTAFGESELHSMDLTNALKIQNAAIEKSPILKNAGFTAGMTPTDIENKIGNLPKPDQIIAKELVASAGQGSPIALFLAGARTVESSQKSLAESAKQVDHGLIYLDNQIIKSTDKVTEAFGSLREGIDTVSSSLIQFASETNQPILSKGLAEFQLSTIINNPKYSSIFKNFGITPENASSKVSEIANQYASDPAKLARDAGALTPILANDSELNTAWNNFMKYATQQMNAINSLNKPYDEASKQAAENAVTLASKQKDINDQVKEFASSDANTKIMSVNKEITNLADEATKLGGALTDLETLRMLKLGVVNKDLFDSVKPLLEISNKLGFTNLNLATAITKDEKGLWSFSQAALDLIPALHNVISNIDAYKASLEALNAAQDTVVKAGMGNIESSVKEIIQNLNADMLKLNSTPELNTQANRGLLVQAANTKGLETIKSYIDEFNNLGLNTYSKSVSGVNKEFGDLAKGLIAMAKELNWTQDQVDYATNAWNELRNARIDELNKKLTDSLKAVYITFSRLDATSLESELYGLSDSFSATIRDIVDNGATLQQAASVINIALATGTRAFEKASKATKDAYAKNYKDMETRYLEISDTIATNAAKSKLDATLAKLSLVDPTSQAYDALAAGAAQAVYTSDLAALAEQKRLRIVDKLNKSQYVATMTTEEANQAYQDQMDAVNALMQLSSERYSTEIENYQKLSDAAKGIRDFIKQFKLSDLATLSPEAKLAEARAQYRVQLSAAQAGDTAAMGSVTGAFNTYAEAAKAYYASSTPYQEIIAQGLSDLSQLGAPETIDISEKIASATQTTADRLKILQDVLKGINDQQQVRLSNDLATLRASTEKVGQQFASGIIDLAATYGVSADKLFAAVNGQGTTAATFLGSSSDSLKTIADNTSGAAITQAVVNAYAQSKSAAVANTPDQLAVNDMTKTFYTKIQNDSLLAFTKSEAGSIYTAIAVACQRSADTLDRISKDSLLAYSAATAGAIYDRIAVASENTVEATRATAHNLVSLGEVVARLHYNMDPNPTYTPVTKFAVGGTFNNGVVNRPTTFGNNLMGEAGPEGILPLANIGGKLGVHAAASDSATTDAVIETGKANTEELRRMREETTALQKEMIAKLVMLERRMAQIESAGALVGAM